VTRAGDPRGHEGPPADPVRARAQALAREAVEAGRPTQWFESLYREAQGDASRVPWADQAPNASLAGWTARPGALDGVRRACVVGCGLGDDAEHLAARGVDVTAFDVSPTAIAWAKRVHPSTRVRYEVADLFALPAAWRGAFHLVVEVYTLQALPAKVRAEAARAVVSLVAPGGRLFLFTRLKDDAAGTPPFDERAAGPPWPLGRTEAADFLDALRVEEPLEETADPDDASIVRAHGVWRRIP
jgi:SAM-dependent methyltransferase